MFSPSASTSSIESVLSLPPTTPSLMSTTTSTDGRESRDGSRRGSVESARSDVDVDELGVLVTPGDEEPPQIQHLPGSVGSVGGIGSVVVKNDVKVTTREVRMGNGEIVDHHPHAQTTMVELRVNDVCVEVIGREHSHSSSSHSHGHSSIGHSSLKTTTTTTTTTAGSISTVRPEKEEKERKGETVRSKSEEIERGRGGGGGKNGGEEKVEMKKRSSSLKRGKGTIKKMWKKVVGSVKA